MIWVEMKVKITVENIVDKSIDDKNADKTLEQEGAQKDGTLATQVIPKAGNKGIVIMVIAGIVLAAVVFGIKNRKLKDIK